LHFPRRVRYKTVIPVSWSITLDYLAFRIRNFKGISDTTIRLAATGRARAHTLIGLNESGKTTLLEAIHSFSPDPDSEVLFPGETFRLEKDDLIPRDKLSNFTGAITVDAKVSLSTDDVSALASHMKRTANVEVAEEALPTSFVIQSSHDYQQSNYVKTANTWGVSFSVKTPKQRHFRKAETEVWREAVGFLRTRLPSIAYYPTFVFNFPEKIYLSGHERDRLNSFYRAIFQDILDYQSEGLRIEDHIVNRIRSDELKLPWVKFLESFMGSNTNAKIDQVFDKASATVSDVIFSRWNDIFKEPAVAREVVVEWRPESGNNEDLHDIYIRFKIKDGSERYDVAQRSLGFRWFFCFLLFTQFRARRRESRGTLFLFDEPASNLHARAQEKLLESFPRICEHPNALIYSTHSHYMIQPHWLEQAYIVENKAIDYEESPAKDLERINRPTDIRAIPYRKFVSDNPSKTTYFQPVLDKLEIKPSGLDRIERSIIVEGKSDYYIINYLSFATGVKPVDIIPGIGAGTMGPLIALLKGWGMPFVILLDGDKAGKGAKERYADDYMLAESEIMLLSDLLPRIKKAEQLLSDMELNAVRDHWGITRRPSKKQIMGCFQENLAMRHKIKISKETKANITNLMDECVARLKGVRKTAAA
jgi:hypothetical protein